MLLVFTRCWCWLFGVVVLHLTLMKGDNMIQIWARFLQNGTQILMDPKLGRLNRLLVNRLGCKRCQSSSSFLLAQQHMTDNLRSLLLRRRLLCCRWPWRVHHMHQRSLLENPWKSSRAVDRVARQHNPVVAVVVVVFVLIGRLMVSKRNSSRQHDEEY